MVLLLNYLPWLVIACTVWLFFVFLVKRKLKFAFLSAILGFCLAALIVVATPSSFPKGTPADLPDVLLVEQKDLPVKNVLRSATPDKEQDEKMKAKFDWRERVKENKEQNQ